jgi:Cytochrome P460
MRKVIVILEASLFISIVLKSCVNHEFSDITTSQNSDQSLFEEVNATGYQYYQNGNTISPASASPHGPFKLRFNEIALSSLDNSGELPENGTFKDGSILVKEIYQNNTLSLYAVIKKAASDPGAAQGWLWSEYALDGTPVISINQKGSGCTNCHGDTPNRDMVRTFDFH